MNEVAFIDHWNLLSDLGFVSDPTVISDEKPGLSFNFGNFKLSAGCVMNMSFEEVVLFTGVLVRPRSLAKVWFEMPRRVASREQCAAWIVWNLDRAEYGSIFYPEREVDWVTEGRQNQNLLPWVVELAAYQARPLCRVKREWLRVALKTLADNLATVSDETAVKLGFNDGVLMIRCGGKVVALPGEGLPWPKYYTILAGTLRHLPKRLMRERIEVSVWNEQLTIGRWAFAGVKEE
jgi:hypothetical protein